jgi:endonuclease/exonuclease/phosphatase family metal-dependent hydrolase
LLRSIFHILGNLLALLTGVGLLARFVPPDMLWPPTLIALMLPVLLLLTALFTALMLYRRRWGAMAFPSFILLLAFSVLGRLFAFGSSVETPTQETLAIATNNARAFKNDAWVAVKKEDVKRVIGQLGADVLMLQESGADKGKHSYAPTILAAGPYFARLQPEGRAIATYAENLKTIAVAVKNYNGYTVADVNTSLGTIRFINAHLQSNQISGLAGNLGKDKNVQDGLDRAESMFRRYARSSRIRARQAEEILRFVEESPHPVIVGGDFNDVPTSYTYQRVLSPRLRDAWTTAGFGLGTTFTGPLPGLRIDFLMVDTSFTIREVKRFETGYSDHRGLRVVISE